MRLLFLPMHGDAAVEIAVLCRGAGVALDIAGASNRLVRAKLTPAEQICLRKLGVGAPSDEEILDAISSGGYSAVMVATPDQVVQCRQRLQSLRPDLPILCRHSTNSFEVLQKLAVENFLSTSPRALSIMRSCHTFLKPKLLDWDALPEISHLPDERRGSGLYVHCFAKYWPHAWNKFADLNRLLGPHAVVNYGMESEQGIVNDLETMGRSRATLHLKDSGACCFAVLRSMAVGTPAVMDRETHERCYFDGLPGIVIRETIPEVAEELLRLASDDEYWVSASKAAYRSARDHAWYGGDLGKAFRRFVDRARRPAKRRTGHSYHERLMQRLFRLHAGLESGCAAAARYSQELLCGPRAQTTPVRCLIGGFPVKLPAEYAGAGLSDWEIAPIRQIQAWLSTTRAPLVIDVGCSLGRISCVVLFAHRRARVVAIDSDIQSVAATQRSCTIAPRARRRLICVHGFVSDRPTSCYDYVQEGRRTAVQLRGRGVSGDPRKIRYKILGSEADDGSITHHSLDGLFWQRASTTEVLIKCDVEGAELHVLRGASNLLASVRPALLLSVHPKHLPRYGHSEEQVAAHLQERGYAMKRLHTDHEQHWFCTPLGE